MFVEFAGPIRALTWGSAVRFSSRTRSIFTVTESEFTGLSYCAAWKDEYHKDCDEDPLSVHGFHPSLVGATVTV